MVEIVPAILPKSFGDLEEKLGLVHKATSFVQIDVVDGIFAPNKTWPYEDSEAFDDIVSEEKGLPFWEELDFEFDLMVVNPEKQVGKFLAAGAARVVLHGDTREVLKILKDDREGALGIKVGMALGSREEAHAFEPYKEFCDFVQVMGIEKIGFQGSAFDPASLNLITSLRAMYPSLTIQIDGGVNLTNIQSIVEAGANRLVVGSDIFQSQDPLEEMKRLVHEANSKI